MGILEFHFHDAEFDFSPSMQTGGEGVEDAFSGGSEEETDLTGESGEESSESGGMGMLVALGVLVVLGVLVGLKRRNSGAGAEGSEEVELEA